MGLWAKYFVYKKENVPKAVDWFINKCNSNHSVRYLVHSSVDLNRIKHSLTRYQKEVLILHGEYDFIELSAPRRLHEIFPNSQLEIIRNCGHMIWIDQAIASKKIIFNFLNGELSDQ